MHLGELLASRILSVIHVWRRGRQTNRKVTRERCRWHGVVGLSRNLCALPRDRSDITRDPQTCTRLTVPGKRATVLIVYCRRLLRQQSKRNAFGLVVTTPATVEWITKWAKARFQLDNAMSSLINRARGLPIFPLSKQYVLDSVRRPTYDVFRSIRTSSYSLHTLHARVICLDEVSGTVSWYVSYRSTQTVVPRMFSNSTDSPITSSIKLPVCYLATKK